MCADIHLDIHNTHKKEITMHAVSLITFFHLKDATILKAVKGEASGEKNGSG